MEEVTRKNTLVLGIIFLVITADQLIKHIIRSQGGFYICNSYIAWGIKIPEAIFWALLLIILTSLTYLIYKEEIKTLNNLFILICLTLICAGALSNMIDRIYVGCVVDYIGFWIFPAFNIADFCIILGVIGVAANFLGTKPGKTL